jgi:8-oxo-dGTP pyrophosphatase MutT (NUDIX family)
MGKVEHDETFRKGLLREIKEESGITRKDIHKITKIFSYEFVLEKVKEEVFLVEVKSDTSIDISNNVVLEHDNYKLVKIDNADRLVKFDTNRIAFYLTRKYLEKHYHGNFNYLPQKDNL